MLSLTVISFVSSRSQSLNRDTELIPPRITVAVLTDCTQSTEHPEDNATDSAKRSRPGQEMEELLQQLTEVSLRQQQIVEHLANRQGQLEQELAAQGAAARPRPAVPDPRIQAAQLLPKMTSYDDPEIFLQMFENVAVTEGWDRQEWARALAPLLTGEAQRSFYAMPADLAANYDDLKREILGRVGLSPICAAQGSLTGRSNHARPAGLKSPSSPV
ncbi:uncharacterized protein LOC122351749 [Puntigrus tetrazona]|uniref:uncharacterized protein LOC122351749 n=1 Tax=Puntigrus tetrazona TaxID=1606681 RepID=UPI001C8AB88D|nr:uncharacterized protein LOC122351749 [Puntigrus tetrazona]